MSLIRLFPTLAQVREKLDEPMTLGYSSAGTVLAVGAGVEELKPGDRVAYGAAPIGSYAEERVIPADRLVTIPDGITDQQAASMIGPGRRLPS